MFYKVKARPEKTAWMRCEPSAKGEKNPGLGAVAERINYLCQPFLRWTRRSWGAANGGGLMRGRRVRGHAGKHVVGAKLQGRRAGHRGTGRFRDLLQHFLQSHAIDHMYQWHRRSRRRPSINIAALYRLRAIPAFLRDKNAPWIRPHGGPGGLCLPGHWLTPQPKDLIILSAVLSLRFFQLNPFTFKHSSAWPN